MKIQSLLALALVALAPLSAVADDSLVKFEGGVGAIPVSAGQGTAVTATVVNRNLVRGVQPAGQLWTIADFVAEVTVDGHITADGRGLVFAGGNAIGTALTLTSTGATADRKVFATLICENVPPFTERNTNLVGVPLAANGDFKIDDVLSPRPTSPSSCATPALLIRNAVGQNWFAAGIQEFDDNRRR
jgi:hypothetical protein